MRWEVTLRRILIEEAEVVVTADTEEEASELAEALYTSGTDAEGDDLSWWEIDDDEDRIVQVRLCRQTGEEGD